MKAQANATVSNSKMSAQQRQRQLAAETKAEKEETRQRNLEQKIREQNRALEMKNMIAQQRQQAAAKREMDFIERQNRTRQQIEEKLQREAEEQA